MKSLPSKTRLIQEVSPKIQTTQDTKVENRPEKIEKNKSYLEIFLLNQLSRALIEEIKAIIVKTIQKSGLNLML